MDGSIQRSGDRVTVTGVTGLSTEAARDVVSSQVRLPREAVRLIARQHLPDGTIVFTFKLLQAALPANSREQTRDASAWPD